ncbi:hypothetical protein [Flavobacterium sp.]|uniref:hypothetical protein n=1 Tax=Flavobacterium sp. TaxID=239 RepID=UPI00262FDA9A|nr:hypothetical protein [Flavobacterium sp.]
MCDFTKGIKLCSCENETIKFREQEFYKMLEGELVKIPNKKNENVPIIFIWRLFKLKSKNNNYEIGRYMLPVNDIGNGLDAEWIALNLNSENCFDFDYTPDEGDNLFIQTNEIASAYISFIFRNGQWKIDHYSPFSWDIRHVKDGQIKETL